MKVVITGPIIGPKPSSITAIRPVENRKHSVHIAATARQSGGRQNVAAPK
jgi:hypothetical protein